MKSRTSGRLIARLQHALAECQRHLNLARGRETAAVRMWKRRISELLRSMRGNRLPRGIRMACMTVAVHLAAGAAGQQFSPPVTNPFGAGSLLGTTQLLFGDLDGDGDLDQIGCHLPFSCQHDLGVEFQENIGMPGAAEFANVIIDNPFGFQPGGNAAFDYIDVFPEMCGDLVDIDADGDLDIIHNGQMVYCYAYNPYEYGFYEMPMFWYENTGTPTSPQFSVSQINPFNLNLDYIPGATAEWQFFDFADIDGDGDPDLIGTSEEYFDDFYRAFIFCENIGTASNPDFAAPVVNPFNLNYPTMPWGHSSSVQLVDMDLDDDLDLVHMMYMIPSEGVIEPRLVYYQNTGTAESPSFAGGVENPFGLVAGLESDYSYIFTCQFVDLDEDGDPDALFNDTDASFYSADNVILPYLYQENTEFSSGIMTAQSADLFIYPNPVSGSSFSVQTGATQGFNYAILDGSGKVVRSGRSASGTLEMEAGALTPGIYTVRCELERGTSSQRFIVH